MNPAVLAALIRGAGAIAARKGAQRGAAAAASKINWSAVANGIADALPTAMRAASAVRSLRAQRDDFQGEGRDEAGEAELARKAFQARIDRGESIHADELAKAPESHVPDELKELAKIVRDARQNGPQPHRPGQGVENPSVPVQQSRVPRGWETRPSFGPSHGTPDPGSEDQKSKDRSLKQMLSNLIFSQTSRAAQGQPVSQTAHHTIGGGNSLGGNNPAGGGGAGNQPPGNQPLGNQGGNVPAGGGGGNQPPGNQPNDPPPGSNPTGRGIADFIVNIGKAAVAVVTFVKGLELFNTGVLALNRDLSQYNGNLAQAYAKYDVDQIQRDIHRADELSGPLSDLAAAQSELRDSTNAVGTQVQALSIGVLSKVTEGVNWLNRMTGLTDGIANALEKIREKIFGAADPPELGPWHTFLADVADGKHDGFEPKFQGPKSLFADDERKRIFGK